MINLANQRTLSMLSISNHWYGRCYDDLSTSRDLYPDAHAEIPLNTLTPKGSSVIITILVDADHAQDKVTCRSITAIACWIML